MSWTWDFVPQGGEWNFGENPLFDWARVVCVVFSMLLLMSILRVVAEARRRPEPLPRAQVALLTRVSLLMNP